MIEEFFDLNCFASFEILYLQMSLISCLLDWIMKLQNLEVGNLASLLQIETFKRISLSFFQLLLNKNSYLPSSLRNLVCSLKASCIAWIYSAM